MNLYVLADCLWIWGGITLSLGFIAKMVEMDCKIDRADYRMQREEDGI